MTDLTGLRPYYDQGQLAGQRGEPKDACRYRRADRRCAWMRGWYAGEDLRVRLEAWRERRHAPRRVSNSAEALR